MNLAKVKTIHFTGIKGVAMTALACCAQDLGMQVSGSDVKEFFVTDEILKKRGIRWQIGFDVKHLPKNLDLLVYTGAFGCQDNVEILEAEKRGLAALNQAQALQLFMAGKKVISVAGVGGKSTTSAMLATLFEAANLRPSFLVGVGDIPGLDAPGRFVRESQFFISEADEYVACKNKDEQPRFLYQDPTLLVITNIEFDHPDVYENLDQTFKAFEKLVNKIPKNGLLVACVDNSNVKRFLKGVNIATQTYGFSEAADWQIVDWRQEKEKQVFSVLHRGMKFGEIELSVPGKFNALNATASLATGVFFGLGFQQIQKGLKKFTGTRRRFELIKKIGDCRLYDDYAHHPKEIQAVLATAKNWLTDQQIIAIFQPHTYSRTQALLSDFSRSFSHAHQVIFLPVYASAREKSTQTVTSYDLYKNTAMFHSKAFYVEDQVSLQRLLTKILKPKTTILTLGAGDIFLWHPRIIKVLQAKESEKND